MTDYYAKLLAEYNKTKPFRRRGWAAERPLEAPRQKWQSYQRDGIRYGSFAPISPRRKRTHMIRLEGDGTLTLLYYGTRAAQLHPDGRVTVYSTTYGGDGMISSWLPYDLRPSSTRGVVFLGNVGSDRRLVRLFYPGVTLARDKKGLWQPCGPGVKPWSIDCIDKVKAREVSQRYHLADFVNWYRAYDGLTDGESESAGLNNPDIVAEALLKRDFIRAYHHLEGVERKIFGYSYGGWYSWTGGRKTNEKKVTMRSITRARLRLYEANGAIIRKTCEVITEAEWNRCILRNSYRAT